MNTSGLYTLVAAIDYLELSATLKPFPQQQQQQQINSEVNHPPPEININFVEPSTENHMFVMPRPPAAPLLQRNDPTELKNLLEATSVRTSSTSELDDKETAAQKRRLIHNNLEKNRRADMKACLEALKNILPTPTRHSGTPYGRLMSTSLTLVRAVNYIKQLESTENDCKLEVEQLTKHKLEMERELATLMAEGTEVEAANKAFDSSLKTADETKTPSATAVKQEPMVITLDGDDKDKDKKGDHHLTSSMDPHPIHAVAPKNAILNTGGLTYASNFFPGTLTPMTNLLPLTPSSGFLVISPSLASPSSAGMNPFDVKLCNISNGFSDNQNIYNGNALGSGNSNLVTATTTAPLPCCNNVNCPFKLVTRLDESSHGKNENDGICGKTLFFPANNYNGEISRYSLRSSATSTPYSRLR